MLVSTYRRFNLSSSSIKGLLSREIHLRMIEMVSLSVIHIIIGLFKLQVAEKILRRSKARLVSVYS